MVDQSLINKTPLKMKNILLSVFAVLLFGLPLRGQIADGSIAPDWTVTDLNGNSYNLYSILNSGKHVVIDFSATWCGPCWNYHNGGALEQLYNTYGPSGTNQVMVFFFEAENNNNTACLYGPTGCVGPNGGTQGNWVAGTPYPIVDLSAIGANSIKTAYQISYFPTLFAINANTKKVYEAGQVSFAGWQSWLFQSFALAVNPAVQQPTCSNNGAINLNTTGGYLNKTYQWSNGATTQNISGLSPGTYSCKVTDFNGYFITTPNFVLTGPPPINLNLTSQTNVVCGGGSTGALSVSASGGTGSIQYAWSNGGTGPSISNIPAGTYTVVVTDGAQCTKTASYTITQPAPLTVSPQVTNASCSQNNGTVLLIEAGGNWPYTYQLNGVSQSTPNFDNLGAGTYNYSVIDVNNCSVSGSVTLSTSVAPVAQASTTSSITCLTPTGTISGTGSSTGGSFGYLWTTSNGAIVSGATQLTATVNAGGTYTLKVTNNGNGCTATSSVTVPSNTTQPTVAIQTPGQLDCNASTVTINASGSSTGSNFAYAWSTADGNIVSGGNSLLPVVDEPGSYALQITNNTNGCISNSSVSVAEDMTQPVITVATETVLTCSQQSAEICATTSSGSVVWNIQGANGNCVTLDQPGQYTLTATGTNGCTSSATSSVVLSNDFPQVTVGEPDLLTCIVTSVSLSGQVNGNPQDFTFTWKDETGAIIANTAEAATENPGTFTLEVLNNANGCQASSSVTVAEITEAPSAQFNSALQDGTVNAAVENVDGLAEYSWTVNGTPEGTGSELSYTLPGPGTFNICLVSSNDCGSNTLCVEYFVAAPLAVQVAGTQVACFGQNNGTASVSVTGGVPQYSYAWTGPDNFTSSEASISGLAPGVYSVVVTDANGQSISSEYTIGQPAALTQGDVIITNDQDNSNSGSVELTVHGGTGSLSYAWSNGSNGTKLGGLGAGEYSCTVTDENGCQQVFGPFVVENVSGVDESEYLTSFNLFPNPAADLINVSAGLVKEGNVTLTLMNAFGREIVAESHRGNFNTRLNVAGMPSGMYFIQLRHRDFTILKKVQVLH